MYIEQLREMVPPLIQSTVAVCNQVTLLMLYYRHADKSLAQPWKETSYSDQDLQYYTKTYGVQRTGIYCCCLYVIGLGIVL